MSRLRKKVAKDEEKDRKEQLQRAIDNLQAYADNYYKQLEDATQIYTNEMRNQYDVAREVAKAKYDIVVEYLGKEEEARRWLNEEMIQITKDEMAANREEFEKWMADFGTWQGNFAWGMEDAKQKVKSWGETWQEIGGQINEQFAGGLTDALFSFGESAQSAGQAFENFAKRTLEWIARIILQQTILNALMGVAGLGGGSGTPHVKVINGSTTAFGMHAGGIVGSDRASFIRSIDPSVFTNALKLHTGGILSDEVPAILKKGEGVFTPEQMRALGANQTSPSVQINHNWAGATIMDQETLRRTLQTVATQTSLEVTRLTAATSVRNSLKGGHPLRRDLKRGI